ncbi:hypothetical protein SDC9_205591 [bioreactor metagenome]|uniref:Uncharacterized protein n=1 Tax=bioreactor metagenome TaxID=1076179 RepID=A0A645J2H6_9ZZZZ
MIFQRPQDAGERAYQIGEIAAKSILVQGVAQSPCIGQYERGGVRQGTDGRIDF